MAAAIPSPALFTDLYELTMAQAYWQSGTIGPATFCLFFRKLPPDRGYLVAAGLESVLAYLERFRFTAEDLAFVRSLGRFDEGFLGFLAGVRFTGAVRAMAEGTLFFPDEPVLEVSGPIIEAQLVETFVVNQVHRQTLLATKAARVRHAAGGRQVIDFGARRCHGTEAANLAARAGYLAGFDGTSNTMAAALYGIEPYGTMAHSFVCAFPTEVESFRQYAASFPDTTSLLVDTYDTVEGVRKALRIAAELRAQGHEVRAVRLDSGDLLALSQATRAMADAAGFPGLKVFASGGLDEFRVDALVRAGAPIDAFGVGTKVGVSADAPHGDCAYKLAEYAGRPVLKLSPRKQTLPGPKQVFRHRGPDGRILDDVITLADEDPPAGSEPLLAPVMLFGRRVGPPVALAESRRRCRVGFASLADRHKALRAPEPFGIRVSDELRRLTADVTAEVQQRELSVLRDCLSTVGG
jgi:nicotinate phosphoribosyltransferase